MSTSISGTGAGTAAPPATTTVPAAYLDSGVYAPLSPGTGVTTSQPQNNTLNSWQAVPFRVSKSVTLAALSINVTTAGSAGAVIRIGLYADSDGRPGALIVDCGTIAADSTGLKDATCTQALTAGTTYWVLTALQVATGASVSVHVPQIQMGRTSTAAAGNPLIGYDSGNTGGTGSISGALPTPLNVGTTVNAGVGNCIRVVGKAA